MIKIIIGVVIVTIVGLVVMQFIDPNSNLYVFGNSSNSTSSTDNDDSAYYTVSGNVINPGKYLLTIDGCTMEDLISAAGGLSSAADERAFYYEAEINQGESYYIPTKYDNANICGSELLTKVNINSDTVENLQKISGIGLVIADAIVDYREANGDFYTIEAIKKVNGIGNSKFAQIKDYIILHE